MPVLVFFAVAIAVGLLLAAIVRLRLRAAAKRPEADVCQLEQASRITSVAVLGSLAGLAVVGVALVVL